MKTQQELNEFLESARTLEERIAQLSADMRQCSELLDGRNRYENVLEIHRLLTEVRKGCEWIVSPVGEGL